jgi:hypothetical protein
MLEFHLIANVTFMAVANVQQFNEHVCSALLNDSLIAHLEESMLFRSVAEVLRN